MYKKRTANNSKSHFGYLNKIVNEYNDMYHQFFDKKYINAVIVFFV